MKHTSHTLKLMLILCGLTSAAFADSDEKEKSDDKENSAAALAAAKETSGNDLKAAFAALEMIKASEDKASNPFKLSAAALIQPLGIDSSAKEFRTSVLPNIQSLLNERLGEWTKIDDGSMRLDPSKLKLATDSDVRVYFLGEGAGYANSLGLNTEGVGVKEGRPELIFANASSNVTYLDPKSTENENSAKRSSNAPLLPGDFVELNTLKAGTALDFFLIADGANGGKNVYSTTGTANPDKINHVVAFAMSNSPYLIIGFEDLFGGGDRDFNDLLFAVEIGAANVASLIATPEPAAWLSLAGLLGMVFWSNSRRRSGMHAPLAA
ncbi:DUF4114 domain-containing protein [Prosthecobacter sp.]|uniref:DUF4114 domain-containing protein n=1 Tax=Prosthecobacter sp. TaxID=1965333 RepID=UPI003783BAFF